MPCREDMRRALVELVGRVEQLPEYEGVCVGKVELNSRNNAQIDAAVEHRWHDALSDIDARVRLALAGDDLPAYLTAAGARRLGFGPEEVLGLCVDARGEEALYRIARRDGMRFDLKLQLRPDSGRAALGLAPERDEPEPGEGRIWPRPTAEHADRFWFVQVQALGKLLRGDYLIADHLANCQTNETLVMQMRLRDDAKGTCVHRYGGRERLEYLAAEAPAFPAADGTAEHIGRKLAAAARAFDALTAAQWPGYRARAEEFYAVWRALEAELAGRDGQVLR